VEAAKRAIVEPGVEPIANTNRIVPAVVGEARDKRKRVTFADAVAAHVEPVAVVVAQLGVDVMPLAVQHSEPVVQQHGRLRLGVMPAHRQSSNAHAAQSDRRRRSAIHICN
jgi:hypothetical protein